MLIIQVASDVVRFQMCVLIFLRGDKIRLSFQRRTNSNPDEVAPEIPQISVFSGK